MKHFKCRKCESSRTQFFKKETGSIVARNVAVRPNFGPKNVVPALWQLWKMSAHSSFFETLKLQFGAHLLEIEWPRRALPLCSDPARGRPRFICFFPPTFFFQVIFLPLLSKASSRGGRVKTQSRGYVKVDEGPFIFLCCGQNAARCGLDRNQFRKRRSVDRRGPGRFRPTRLVCPLRRLFIEILPRPAI